MFEGDSWGHFGELAKILQAKEFLRQTHLGANIRYLRYAIDYSMINRSVQVSIEKYC